MAIQRIMRGGEVKYRVGDDGREYNTREQAEAAQRSGSRPTFRGSTCTSDCSGHRTGYAWSRRNAGRACDAKSASFNKGCEIAKRDMRR